MLSTYMGGGEKNEMDFCTNKLAQKKNYTVFINLFIVLTD